MDEEETTTSIPSVQDVKDEPPSSEKFLDKTGSDTSNGILTLKELIPDKAERAKAFETFHFIFYLILYETVLFYYNAWKRTYSIGTWMRVVGTFACKMVQLPMPVDDLAVDLGCELLTPPGQVLRVGNPKFYPKETLDSWKYGLYHVSLIVADIGSVTAGLAVETSLTMLNGITYWFAQTEEMKSRDELTVAYGKTSFFISFFWTGPCIVQTYEHARVLAAKGCHPIYVMRDIIHILLFILLEAKILRDIVSWFWMK